MHHCEQFFAAILTQKTLSHLKIAITAGPTREALDPVRFISNHSSGKMGFAIAKAAAALGAQVTLISGPVNLATPTGVTRIDVESAEQMAQAALNTASTQHIFIGCAAVADYRAQQIAEQKMKKQSGEETLTLTLVKNPDIIATVAALSQNRPFTVGFAAETEQVAKYAQDKLQRKNLDLICANDVSSKEQGFNSDQNALHLYWQGGDKALPLCHKEQLAQQLITEIVARYHESH